MSPPRLGRLEIAAEDAAAAAAAWQRCLGIHFRAGEGLTADVGGIELRLVPAGDGQPGLRGLVIEVDDLVEAVGTMAAAGIETAAGEDGSLDREIALDPRTTFGVQITLTEAEGKS